MHIVLLSPLLTVENRLLSNSWHLPLHIELDFLLNLKNNPKNPAKTPDKTNHNTKRISHQKPQKSFEDRIWQVLFMVCHTTSSSSCIRDLPFCLTLIPVNLHCQESLAWGSIGHLGVNYEGTTRCKWRLYIVQPNVFPKPLENNPQDPEEATEEQAADPLFIAFLRRDAEGWKRGSVPA